MADMICVILSLIYLCGINIFVHDNDVCDGVAWTITVRMFECLNIRNDGEQTK